MAAHYNSASRLLSIIDKFLSNQTNVSVVDSWARVFDIGDDSGHARPFLITERLCALHEELERMELSLRETAYGEDLYLQPISLARRAFSPENLPTANNQVKSWLDANVKVPFRYMVPALPSDFQEFSDGDLIQLNELIAQLQGIVQVSSASPAVLNVVRNHIALLLRALALYPIKGPLALTEALKMMAVELYENEAAINEFADTEEVGLLKLTWQHAKKMAAAASTTSGVIALATLGWEAAKAISR